MAAFDRFYCISNFRLKNIAYESLHIITFEKMFSSTKSLIHVDLYIFSVSAMKTNEMTCALSEDLDQPGHTHSLFSIK